MNGTKPLDRRTKYSMEAIRNALFALLEEKELSAVTVTDVCRLADVNRGTFYRYFKDVPDLFSHIEDEFIASFQEVLLSVDDMTSYYRSILLTIKENQLPDPVPSEQQQHFPYYRETDAAPQKFSFWTS